MKNKQIEQKYFIDNKYLYVDFGNLKEGSYHGKIKVDKDLWLKYVSARYEFELLDKEIRNLLPKTAKKKIEKHTKQNSISEQHTEKSEGKRPTKLHLFIGGHSEFTYFLRKYDFNPCEWVNITRKEELNRHQLAKGYIHFGDSAFQIRDIDEIENYIKFKTQNE